MTDTLTAAQSNYDRLRYAEACLKQGMSYQAAAQASGLCVSDLMAHSPGHVPAHRPPPGSALQQCAAVLPSASDLERRQVIALAIAIQSDRCGASETKTAVAGAFAALPSEKIEARRKTMRVVAHDVARFVASQYGLSFHDLCSERRSRNFARPRQIAMYTIKRLCSHMSYPAIGRLFGGRDHTTALHGFRKIEELIATDPEIAAVVTLVMSHFEREAEDDTFAPPLLHQAMQFQALCSAYGRAMGLAA